jgi:uncharacterized protein YcbK (DUF882 family)
MRLKQGVKINCIKPQMVIALNIIEKVWESLGIELVVTSVCDSVHSKNSLHYVGFAADIRIRDFKTKEKLNLAIKNIKRNIGKQFDVILESDHIHIEYQPKGQ